MTYDVGDRTRLTATFTDDITGNPADPTVITLRVKPPKTNAIVMVSNSSPQQIFKDSTGVYHADIDVTVSGTWHYKWFGTGSLVAAEEATFFVRPTTTSNV